MYFTLKMCVHALVYKYMYRIIAGMNVYDDLIHGLSICEMAYLFVDSYSGLMDVLLISLF